MWGDEWARDAYDGAADPGNYPLFSFAGTADPRAGAVVMYDARADRFVFYKGSLLVDAVDAHALDWVLGRKPKRAGAFQVPIEVLALRYFEETDFLASLQPGDSP